MDILNKAWVSVPIRGLFNLTFCVAGLRLFGLLLFRFRPHQGII